MRVTEKMQLIENIAVTLQERYTFDDLDMFFGEFDVSEANGSYSSKRVYAKDRLRGAKNSELKKIATELGLDTDHIIKTPPKNWENTASVKAFISHTATHKEYATRLRDVLKPHNIDCFVAHEDIKPSEEWMEEIRKALNTMDFFISIHTNGFSERIWCQQEIGYATARNVKIIPVKFDEDPEGFIGKYQALIRRKKNAEEIGQDILGLLADDEKTKDLYAEKIAPPPSLDDEFPF